jgi:hypothetical protein
MLETPHHRRRQCRNDNNDHHGIAPLPSSVNGDVCPRMGTG